MEHAQQDRTTCLLGLANHTHCLVDIVDRNDTHAGKALKSAFDRDLDFHYDEDG
jgi:hypothetical protein